MFGNVIKIVVLAALLIAVDMVFEVNFPAVREININTEKLGKGKEVTLLQISDFHGSNSEEIVQRLIKALGNIKLDAVLITGDLVDRSTEDFDNVYSLIRELHSLCPSIFFVSGNHEWGNDRRKELLVELKDMGVVILDNKGSTFATNSAGINICGVDDAYGRRDNIEKAMKGVNGNNYTVLLSHSPKIRQRLGHFSPDLILCGHTHGGQIRLPFIGAIIEPGEGFFHILTKECLN